MTFNQLRALAEVARTGSVRAAAATLVVSEPSVSASIAALERHLGTDLLIRHGRGVRLTPAGAEMAKHAAEILGLADTAQRRTTEAATGRVQLRIGAVTTAAEFVLPPYLKRFMKKHPDSQLWMEVGNREQVFSLLAQHQIDVAIGGRPPQGAAHGHPFRANPLIVVSAPGHTLASQRTIEPADLRDATWLMREPGSGTRTNVEEFFEGSEVKPSSSMTLGSNGAVKEAASLGLGIALVSELAVEKELRAGQLVRLKVRGTPLRRDWHASWMSEPSPGVAAFLEILRPRASVT